MCMCTREMSREMKCLILLRKMYLNTIKRERENISMKVTSLRKGYEMAIIRITLQAAKEIKENLRNLLEESACQVAFTLVGNSFQGGNMALEGELIQIMYL